MRDPKYTSSQFFSLDGPPFNLDFVEESVEKSQIRPNWADWQTPPIVKNGIVGPQEHKLTFLA